MKKVIIVGKIENNTEVMMSKNNLEIIEYKIDGIKVKSFGKVANTAKSLSGIVTADGTIDLRDYTNKDGKTYPIQEIIISKIEGLAEQPKDNFDITPSDFSSGETKIPSAKEIEISPEELPFY